MKEGKSMLSRLIRYMPFGLLISCQGPADHGSFDFSDVNQKIQTWVDSTYYSGASICIGQGDKVLFEAFYGDFDAETVVYVASAGKWVAAAVIAAVVDRGLLSWDDKVVSYLPEMKDVKGQSSLRQLMSHTAGYPAYQPEYRRHDDYQSLGESVKQIMDLPADTLPGTIFHYGGLAMQVAGRIAEIAKGRDWESLFCEYIASPLGMKSSHFTPVDSFPGHNPMLGGGFRTTLYDYTMFLQMISCQGSWRGERILTPEAIGEMEKDQIGNAFVPAGEFVEYVRNSHHQAVYGLGLWREELDADGRATLLSSPGWAGTYPWVDRATGIWGVFLAHVQGKKAEADGFNPFYESPVLAVIIRDALSKAAFKPHPGSF